MIIAGIDPGKTGAMVILYPDIACEKAADKFILNNTGKGSRAEVVKVL